MPISAKADHALDGGYALARPAEQITVADVLPVIEGPLATLAELVGGELPHEVTRSSDVPEAWLPR